MSQKHLLGFIQDKARNEPDTVVLTRNNNPMTLKQVFQKLNLNAHFLNVDSLDVHAVGSIIIHVQFGDLF